MTRPDDESATFAGSLDDHLVAPEPSATPSSRAAPIPGPGRRRYDLGGELARGGLGRVQRAWDTSLEREVAIKTLLKPSPRAVARFDRETRITAHLEHPNIVPVHDGGRTPDGDPYLAMRLVRGRSLADAIAERKTLTERMGLLPHVIDACNAIAYAHEQRVAHRDIKPDNVLVGDFGETVVIDWGLAKELDVEATEELSFDGTETPSDPRRSSTLSSNASLTRVGTVMGTPSYMAPEQAAGRPIDERSDVYALGAALYHTLAGFRPYHGTPDTLSAVNAGPPKALELFVPDVPRDLLAVTRKAMARDPADRYPDARSLAADLARFQAGAFVGAHHYTARERIRRAMVQNPVATALLALLVVGTAVGVGLLWRASRIAEAGRAEAEAARADAVELQEAERERLDALTVDQARWSLNSDPGRSLTLLDGLSETHPFDAQVRAIASEAWAASPPRRLPLGADARGEPEISWNEHGLVLCADHALLAFDPALQPLTESRPDEPVRACGVTPTGGLIWVGQRAVRFDWDGQPREFPIRTDGGSTTLATRGDRILWVDEDALTVFDGQARSTSEMNAQRAVFATDGRIVTHGKQSIGVFDVDSWRSLGIVPLRRQIYGLFASSVAPEALLVGDSGEVVRVRWDEGRIRADAVQVAGSWFDIGAWMAPGVAVIGGAGDEVVEVDFGAGTSRRLARLDSAPESLAAREDGTIAVGTELGSIDLVSWPTGDVASLARGGRPVTALAWSPDGARLIAGRRGEAHVWTPEARGGERVARLPGVVMTLHTGPQQQLIVGTTRGVHEVSAQGAVRALVDEVPGVGVWCDGRTWVGVTGKFMAFETMDGPSQTYPTSGVPRDLRCSPDGRHLVVDRVRHGVTVLDLATGVESAPLAEPALVSQPALGPGGALLIGGMNAVLFPSLSGPGEVLSEPGNPAAFYVGWAGETPTWVDLDGRVSQRIGGRTVARAPHTGMPTGMVVSSRAIVVTDGEGGVWFWTSPEGEGQARYEHRQYVHTVAPHPSGRWVATGGWDDLVVLWDLDHPRIPARILRGHREAVMSLVWSSDGKTLYSGDRRGEVRAWTDPLATDPVALRAQVHAMASAIRAGLPLPDPSVQDASIPR